MNIRKCRFFYWILLTVSTQSQATSFYPQPFPRTVGQAPHVIRGKIGMNYSDWGKDEGGTKRIYTYYELQVTEVLKGPEKPNGTPTVSPNIMFREMGGVKDGIGMEVGGASQFQRGEDVVVFLRDKGPDGFFEVQGLMMGKMNIQLDSDGQEILSGPALMTEVTDGSHPNPPQKWSLNALRSLINHPPTHSDPPAQAAPQASESLIPTASNLSGPAPQLQPQDDVESPHRNWILWAHRVCWILCALSAGLGGLILLRSLRDGPK